MYGRHKSSWKQLSDARLECRAKEFIRIELELALTFVKVAHTKYSMRNVAGGDFSRNNAEKAFHEALNYQTPEAVYFGVNATKTAMLRIGLAADRRL